MTVVNTAVNTADTTPDITQDRGIRWQCRRGMLELDILLNNFVDSFTENGPYSCIGSATDNVAATSSNKSTEPLTSKQLTSNQKQTFVLLLTYPDQTLFDLLLGNAMSSDPEISSIIKLIQSTSSY